jgi:Triose-phosphate Transporter family
VACRWLQPITKQEFKQIFWPASMHAIGHIAANLSFAAVAISLTHTVKTLEPAFNVVLSRALLGTVTPTPVIATLVPIMVSHSMVSREVPSGGLPCAVSTGLCLVAHVILWTLDIGG